MHFYNSVLINRILKCDSESILLPGRQAGHTRADRVTGRRSRSSAMSWPRVMSPVAEARSQPGCSTRSRTRWPPADRAGDQPSRSLEKVPTKALVGAFSVIVKLQTSRRFVCSSTISLAQRGEAHVHHEVGGGHAVAAGRAPTEPGGRGMGHYAFKYNIGLSKIAIESFR